jgi:hypothetical protein
MCVAVMRLQLNLLKASDPNYFSGSVSAFVATAEADSPPRPPGGAGVLRNRPNRRHPFTLTFTFGNAATSFQTSSSVSTKPNASVHAPAPLDSEQALPDVPPSTNKTESNAHQHQRASIDVNSVREVQPEPEEEPKNANDHDLEKGIALPERTTTIRHQTQPSQESHRKNSGGARLSKSLKRKKTSEEGGGEGKAQEAFAMQDVTRRSTSPKLPPIDTITYTFGLPDIAKDIKTPALAPSQGTHEGRRE